MNYLITRNTMTDMAGIAMMKGAMIGLKEMDPAAKFAALVRPENDSESRIIPAYIDPDGCDAAFNWADCVLDIGGLCAGFDWARARYIRICREIDIPYIYMAQSFINPNPKIIKDIPIVARGPRAAQAIKEITGTTPLVGADLSFLIEPVKKKFPKYKRGYTTHEGKPFGDMLATFREKLSMQLIWKPGAEPLLNDNYMLPLFSGPPASMFGMIAELDEIHTARYHSAVGAVMYGKPCYFYVNDRTKYDDLMYFEGMPIDELKKSAMVSCEFVIEIMKG